MKTVLGYFKLHSKKSLIRFLIIAFICLVVVTLVTQGIISDYDGNKLYEQTEAKHHYNTFIWSVDPQLTFMAVIVAILTTILPMAELAAFNNRRFLDSAFSFPISRSAMLSVHLVNGFLQFLISYSLSYIWLAIRLLHCADKLNFAPIREFFFMSLLYACFLYSFNAFFFSLCNSTADGAIVAISWQFILCPVALTLTEMFNIKWFDQILLIVWMPLMRISSHCGTLAKGYDSYPNLSTGFDHAILASLICAAALAILLCGLTIHFFNQKRAERAGELSDTAVGYKLLIPLCTAMLIYWAITADASIISILALIYSTVGYIIYRRGFKFRMPDIIVIAASLLCSLMAITSFG